MGKLDYLQKHTGKPKKAKKSIVVVPSDDSIHSNTETDDVPVVESKFKGFKRLDNTPVRDERDEPAEQPVGKNQETVYRDLTGKVIDITQAKATAKGSSVVLEQEEERTAPASFTVSRSDKQYNEMLKRRSNFEDPFKLKQQADRLAYSKGVNLPNRFAIKAGALWDGIDRSNGFEKLVMQKRTGAKAERKREAHEYELDFE